MAGTKTFLQELEAGNGYPPASLKPIPAAGIGDAPVEAIVEQMISVAKRVRQRADFPESITDPLVQMVRYHLLVGRSGQKLRDQEFRSAMADRNKAAEAAEAAWSEEAARFRDVDLAAFRPIAVQQAIDLVYQSRVVREFEYRAIYRARDVLKNIRHPLRENDDIERAASIYHGSSGSNSELANAMTMKIGRHALAAELADTHPAESRSAAVTAAIEFLQAEPAQWQDFNDPSGVFPTAETGRAAAL